MSDTMTKLRVLHLIVHPVLVLDDGTEFTPGPKVNPATVRPSELPALAAEIAATVQDMQAKMDAAGSPQP